MMFHKINRTIKNITTDKWNIIAGSTLIGTSNEPHTSKWTKSKRACEVESLLVKDKAVHLASVQSQLVCNLPKT